MGTFSRRTLGQIIGLAAALCCVAAAAHAAPSGHPPASGSRSWSNNAAPALNATNLNAIETEISDLYKYPADAVDILEAYGSGTSRTDATISTAVADLGTSTEYCCILTHGAWTLDANLDLSSYTNLTFFLMPGCDLQLAAAALTFGGPVVVMPGATITEASGSSTVTISGAFEAPPCAVFFGFEDGDVSISAATVYPEWFGAVGDGATDDSTAINLALGAAGEGGCVALGPRQYKVTAATVQIDKDNAVLRGRGASATQLVAGATDVPIVSVDDAAYWSIADIAFVSCASYASPHVRLVGTTGAVSHGLIRDCLAYGSTDYAAGECFVSFEGAAGGSVNRNVVSGCRALWVHSGYRFVPSANYSQGNVIAGTSVGPAVYGWYMDNASGGVDGNRISGAFNAYAGTEAAIFLDGVGNQYYVSVFDVPAEKYDVHIQAGAYGNIVEGFFDYNQVQDDSPGLGNTLITYNMAQFRDRASVLGSSPLMYQWNTTEEDADGGRESTQRWYGEKGDGTVHSLRKVTVSHYGSGDDQQGKVEDFVNVSADGNSPTQGWEMSKDGFVAKIATAAPLEAYRKNGQSVNWASGLKLSLENDASEKVAYATIYGKIVTNADGAEDGSVAIYCKVGGSDVERWTLSKDGDAAADGALSSGTVTVTALGPTDDLDVSHVNTVFINTGSNHVTIGGFTGGVAGQVLHVVVKNATNNTTLEHAEGTGNQDIYLNAGADETLTAAYGGWTLVCDGTHWYEAGK